VSSRESSVRLIVGDGVGWDLVLDSADVADGDALNVRSLSVNDGDGVRRDDVRVVTALTPGGLLRETTMNTASAVIVRIIWYKKEEVVLTLLQTKAVSKVWKLPTKANLGDESKVINL
jgi:hypothetical protein